MRVLVLGGYGLIGEAVVDRLARDGHEVAGLGRNVSQARRRKPAVRWIEADMARLQAAEDWLPHLAGFDAVVNAAGALQDGARDNLDALHRVSIVALVVGCERTDAKRLIQISATGAMLGAESAFMRTKAEGDQAVANSSLDWTIFRPGLVIAPTAYGGTALLRALAGFPFFAPVAYANANIQTVSIDDVTGAVAAALEGKALHQSIDLVEDGPHQLGDVVLAFRRWLGVAPDRVLRLPGWLGSVTAALADLAGRLGWRSPLRSTAIATLRAGVTGDPAPWVAVSGYHQRSLSETLAGMPSTVQERWFARMWLLKPVVILILFMFWLVSGVIGFAQFDKAVAVLTARGFDTQLASLFVAAGGVADIVVGISVLFRRFARWALFGMMGVTLCYLAAATFYTPDLWADPLGPMVKTLPALALILIALGVLEER